MRKVWIRVLLASCVAVAALAASTGTATAVVDGQPDGNQHPNVGIIIGFDASGASVYFCTGTLVAPTTVLTAAHCVSPALEPTVVRTVVTFQAQLGRLPDGRFDSSPSIQGTPEPNPAWFPTLVPTDLHGGANAFFDNSALDIGLLHLDQPAANVFPGILPAPITAPDTNELYRTGNVKELLLQVGYGVGRDGPSGRPSSYFVDGARNQSLVTPKKVTDGLLVFDANPNDQAGYGSPCSGDSGSPVFRATTVVALFVFAGGNCHNTGGGPASTPAPDAPSSRPTAWCPRPRPSRSRGA